jgi:6-phosphogluconate dehydrogenase
MVLHAVVDSVINEITPYLSKGDIVIEAEDIVRTIVEREPEFVH